MTGFSSKSVQMYLNIGSGPGVGGEAILAHLDHLEGVRLGPIVPTCSRKFLVRTIGYLTQHIAASPPVPAGDPYAEVDRLLTELIAAAGKLREPVEEDERAIEDATRLVGKFYSDLTHGGRDAGRVIADAPVVDTTDHPARG